MGFLDAFKGLFGGSSGRDEAGYWIYVRCRRCGEVVRTRLDLRNDLSLNDDGSYTVHKTLVGDRLCFQRIEVTLTFDAQRRLIERDIHGGEFATAEEYQPEE